MRILSLIMILLAILALAGCQTVPAEQQERGQAGQEQPPTAGNMQEDYLDEALEIIDDVEPE